MPTNPTKDGKIARTTWARPLWVPAGLQVEQLPQELRAVLIKVIGPIYQELVLNAPSALEKMAGLTNVHLQWLEILGQIELGRAINEPAELTSPSEEREQLMARHLRVVNAKLKAANFLRQLQELRRKRGDEIQQNPSATPQDSRGTQ